MLHIAATFGLVTGQTTVSSDVTSKYNKLGEPYQQGFILETFKAMPGVGKIGWNANETPYQGIFSRPLGYGNQLNTVHKMYRHKINVHVTWSLSINYCLILCFSAWEAIKFGYVVLIKIISKFNLL